MVISPNFRIHFTVINSQINLHFNRFSINSPIGKPPVNIVFYLLRFYKTTDGTWKTDKVIDVPAKKVTKDGVESELNGNFT